ncbi:hypothetical protein [Roseivirga pacifica]|uniref:hypothetical protein n=1 Tax=Roseivirga pacifica TaxID=1267423 RepID=UPI003BB2131C
MKPIITLFLLFGCFLAHTQTLESFERHFTWNPDSTLVHAQASMDSRILAKLPYGTEVLKQAELKDRKYYLLIGELDGAIDEPEKAAGYAIPTYWVHIKHDNIEGYALNAEVINFPPYSLTQHGYFVLDMDVVKDVYGSKPERFKITKVQNWEDGGSYEVKVDSLSFKDGSYQLSQYFDSCFDRTYYYRGKPIDQVYFMFKTQYYLRIPVKGKSDHILFPRLKGVEATKFLFDHVEAHNDIYIDFSNTEIIFGSYDCT